MTQLFRFRTCAALLWLAIHATGLSAAMTEPFPGVDAKWRYYQSPNFELYSRNSDSESRDLLYKLELVRAVFFENFKLKPRRAVPLTVFFFAREKYFDAYLPQATRAIDNIGAFYHPDADRGTILMAPTPTFEAAQQLAFGSYTYHLFSLIDERPPLWYVIGMSGVFRNLELNPSYIGFGKPDADQIRRLQGENLLPADALLFAEHSSPVYASNRTHQVFVDQSWALLHYLYFGQHKIPREKIERLIEFILTKSKDASTAQLREAVGTALGMNFDKLNGALDSYARGGRYGWSKLPVPKVAGQKSYTQRPVPLAEIHLRLAELASRMNDNPLGKLALLNAAGDPSAEARVHEALGASDYRAGNIDQAAERWSRALESGTENPAIFYELSVLESQRKFQRFDLNFRLPDEAAARLRDLLLRSIKAVPDQTTAYEMLAWVEATAKAPIIANINMVQGRFPTLRNKPRTLLALAVIRLRVDDRATALALLDELDKMGPDASTAYGAEITRAKLEDRPVDRQKLPPATDGLRFRFELPKLELPR